MEANAKRLSTCDTPALACMAFFWSPQFAGGERVAKTVGDGARLDSGLDVELATLLDTLLQVAVDIAGDFAEEHSEKVGHERTTKIDALLAEVVTVVNLATVKRSKQETVDHVTEEVGLLGVEPSEVEMWGSISFCRISCA